MNDFTQQQAELVQRFLVWRTAIDARVGSYDFIDREKRIIVTSYHVALWYDDLNEASECVTVLTSVKHFVSFMKLIQHAYEHDTTTPCPLAGDVLESIGVDPNYDETYAARMLQS